MQIATVEMVMNKTSKGQWLMVTSHKLEKKKDNASATKYNLRKLKNLEQNSSIENILSDHYSLSFHYFPTNK
ncbi:hypothetical protein ACH3XW_33690 [Acanthocheilonema viteae]